MRRRTGTAQAPRRGPRTGPRRGAFGVRVRPRSPAAGRILHPYPAKLHVEDEVRRWLTVAVGDGLVHRAEPHEGGLVGNDRVAPGAVVGHLPPRPRSHLRRVA